VVNDELEAALWRAIAADPTDPGPRGVLADLYVERGDPWGTFMSTERLGRPTQVGRSDAEVAELLRVERDARTSMARALGLPPDRWVDVGTSHGLPDRVRLEHVPDPTRPVWAVVSHADFSALRSDVVRLLAAGREAHGWSRLSSLAGVTLDQLWALRPWSLGRFTELTLHDTQASMMPSALRAMLQPRPTRVELRGAWRLVVHRRVDLNEVRITCEPGHAEELLLELLTHVVAGGEHLVWSRGQLSAEFSRRLAEVLPGHSQGERAGRLFV
jgi:uncharacterized protein (TIGR02996 family)